MENEELAILSIEYDGKEDCRGCAHIFMCTDNVMNNNRACDEYRSESREAITSLLNNVYMVTDRIEKRPVIYGFSLNINNSHN